VTTRKGGPPIECCRWWMGIPKSQREQWGYQVIHRYSHSRTAFKPATLAEVARVTTGEAERLIADAELRKWLWTPQAGVWVGRLPTRR
jgi:hypothetical protein